MAADSARHFSPWPTSNGYSTGIARPGSVLLVRDVSIETIERTVKDLMDCDEFEQAFLRLGGA
jgi:hypothetical protein